MHKKLSATRYAYLVFAFTVALVNMTGCGGNAKTAGSSPNSPTSPSPTPTPATPSSTSLTATPTSLGFGSQALNTTTTQSVTLKNTGTTAIDITKDTISGAGFSVGITTPITLNPTQSVTVPVVFTPGTAGTVSGSLTLTSSGITLSIPLSGTGLAPLAHSVDITWGASTSTTLQGYNVYRGGTSGGPYSKISPLLASSTLLFTDTTPVSGQKYFYVVTAVDNSGAESAASTEVAVTIPVP
ncbi:MAG TPA: choice-of-anchor D domain-containing protein [Candidatus Angelobacter sp.]|nr:choice-of-anchor D domain-containing protein [Candidatus Angelobacter sp.]